jgi:hypothetical protein
MKTSALTFISLLFLPFFTSAQGFSMGFYLQPQMTKIGGDITYETTNAVYKIKPETSYGFAFGLQSAYHFSTSTALSFGVTFSTQQQNYEDLSLMTAPDVQSKTTYSTRVDYIKLPLLFEYTLNPDKKVAFNIYGGLHIGFLASYNIKSSVDVSGPGSSDNYSLAMTASNTSIAAHVVSNDTTDLVYVSLTEECYNTFEVGAQFGAGIVWNVSDKFSIPVSLNYEFSFSDMRNSGSYWDSGHGNASFWDFSDTNSSGPIKNSLLGLRIGVRMKIGENPTFD